MDPRGYGYHYGYLLNLYMVDMLERDIYAGQSLSGWWFQPTPLKNDGVRQWEGWHPIYYGNNHIPGYHYGYLYMVDMDIW